MGFRPDAQPRGALEARAVSDRKTSHAAASIAVALRVTMRLRLRSRSRAVSSSLRRTGVSSMPASAAAISLRVAPPGPFRQRLAVKSRFAPSIGRAAGQPCIPFLAFLRRRLRKRSFMGHLKICALIRLRQLGQGENTRSGYPTRSHAESLRPFRKPDSALRYGVKNVLLLLSHKAAFFSKA